MKNNASPKPTGDEKRNGRKHLNLEDTTTTTPTNFASESFNGNVFAIVRQNNAEELRMIVQPYQLHHNPSVDEICDYHNYSPYMSSAYSDCLSHINTNRELDSNALDTRRRAIAMEDTIKEIRRHNDVVACSHRYGGWTGIDWDFGKDVKYTISTNFGYGSCSYFHLLVKYKDLLLTPYTDYIRYRNANFSTLHKYTHAYPVSEEQWENVMKDALNFYNAVVHKKECYIFSWLIGHLDRMTAGIEELRTALSFTFESACSTQRSAVTGEELTIVKANKIANSLEFVENISILPVEITPQRYVDRITSVCRTYLPDLITLICKKEAERDRLQVRLGELESEVDYATYSEIRERCWQKRKWYLTSQKRSMFRFLLRLQHQTMRGLTRIERKRRIEALENCRKEVDEIKDKLSHLGYVVNNLTTCRKKIEAYFEQPEIKTA